MNRSSQSGSHVIALALVVLFVAVAGFAGYKVYTMQQAATSGAPTSTSATVPAKITNTATLNQASSALDAVSTQVNSNLDDSALNSDLNDLL